MALRFDVVTIFPAMFAAVSEHGITSRALSQGTWALQTWNPRDYAEDAYRRVDDRPFGGGPGMVMSPEPLARAIEAARDGDHGARVVLMSPQGARFVDATARRTAEQGGRTVLVCGRYEAVDERLVRSMVDEEWSIGDFVLSGGEIAAMAVIDAVVRRLPGALGDEASALQDSFGEALDGLLDCPHYTRPETWRGLAAPAELLSGHHANIERWRRERSLETTLARRPELIERARRAGRLSPDDEKYLSGLRGGRSIPRAGD